MLGKLISRFAPASPGRAADHLFTPFAPNGAPAHLLSHLFHQYADAPPDEPPPPQHKHYRALVLELFHLNGGKRPPAEHLNAAYITCFERDDAFQVLLRVWRSDVDFCARLNEVRVQVIAELLENERAEAARRAHFARWRECLETPLDIWGETRLSLLLKMSPDDWHQIALGWDWNDGVEELEWIAAQRACDRATALYILCCGWPGDVALHKPRPHAGMIRDIAARLEGGFYMNAAFALALSTRQRIAFQQQLDLARATGESPWQIDADILDQPGQRAHAPKYAVTNGRLHFHYEYWLTQLAPAMR